MASSTTTSGIKVCLNLYGPLDALERNVICTDQDFVPRKGDIVYLLEPYFYGEVVRVVCEYDAQGVRFVMVYVRAIEKQ